MITLMTLMLSLKILFHQNPLFLLVTAIVRQTPYPQSDVSYRMLPANPTAS